MGRADMTRNKLMSLLAVVVVGVLAGVLFPGCGADDTAEGGGGGSNLCGEGTVFSDGKCIAGACPAGEVAIDGECKPNPCGEGTVLVDGKCVIDSTSGADTIGGDGTSGSTSGVTDSDTSGSTSGTSGTTSGDTSGGTTSGGDCIDSQRRCQGNSVEVCRSGAYQPETTCGDGTTCVGGSCQADGEVLIGTCGGGPVTLTLDAPAINGTTNTNTIEPLSWSQSCTQKYNKEAGLGGTFLAPTGPQNVYSLDIPDSRYVEVKVEPLPSSPTYFALYAMGDCSRETTFTRRACTGSISQGGAATITQLFAKGTYNFVADSFGSSPADLGEYTIAAKSIAPQACHIDPSNASLNINAVPRVVQFNELGYYSHEGNTILGADETNWNESSAVSCQLSRTSSSSGPEVLYAFALHERKQVQIKVTTLGVTSGSDNGIAFFLRADCGNKYYDSRFIADTGITKACGEGSAANVATVTNTIEPGSYFLFIDEMSKTAARDYRLEIQLLD